METNDIKVTFSLESSQRDGIRVVILTFKKLAVDYREPAVTWLWSASDENKRSVSAKSC